MEKETEKVFEPSILCVGVGCPIKHDCKCYLAHKAAQKNGTDGKTVDYFSDVPYEYDSNSCVFYWKER